MIRLVPIGLAFAAAVAIHAHRLDEYLQATRIAVTPDRIDFKIDLTPGVAVFSELLPQIDTNSDARISAAEGRRYASKLLDDLRVSLDETPKKLRLIRIDFPPVDDMKTGEGVIRLKACLEVDPLRTGRHQLTLRNSHLPRISVYLVNALVPRDPHIEIRTQSRNKLQTDYKLEFEVNSTVSNGSP